eukprot:1124654-Prorocentrum_minimum.AAC.1
MVRWWAPTPRTALKHAKLTGHQSQGPPLGARRRLGPRPRVCPLRVDGRRPRRRTCTWRRTSTCRMRRGCLRATR